MQPAWADERFRVFVAPAGFEAPLSGELARKSLPVAFRRGRLFVCPADAAAGAPVAWAQNVWEEARFAPAPSIGDGARVLKNLGGLWAFHESACAAGCRRRAALIEEHLRPMRRRPLEFGSPLPAAPLGAWTLWERDTLLLAPRTSSPFADGEAHFAEDRTGPPSRAYLKLWEAFTLLKKHPRAGERCLDLGASPGGWSWVLATLGAEVASVDKAPLEGALLRLPNVRCLSASAFSLDPVRLPFGWKRADWLFSDVICYPGRMLGLVRRFVAADAATRILCTLKFQGETDHAAAEAFAAIPGGRLMHLSVNRHELTFFWERPEEDACHIS